MTQQQSINKKFGRCYLTMLFIVIACYIFFSCTTRTSITSRIDMGGIPVYSLDQEAVVGGIYKFKIHKIYCMPQMVIEASITNITNKPIAFGLLSTNHYLLSFRLLDEQGTEYAMTGFDNLTYKMGSVILNPNRSLSGQIIFDVPKNKYTLIATEQVLVASYTVPAKKVVFKNSDLFKYRLPECFIE